MARGNQREIDRQRAQKRKEKGKKDKSDHVKEMAKDADIMREKQKKAEEKKQKEEEEKAKAAYLAEYQK